MKRGRKPFTSITQCKQHCSRCGTALTPENGYLYSDKYQYTPYCKSCNRIIAWERMWKKKTDMEIMTEISKTRAKVERLVQILTKRGTGEATQKIVEK